MRSKNLAGRGWASVVGGVLGGFALLSAVAASAATNSGSAGGGAAVNNMQPALVLNYIIAMQGIFPSRDSGSNVGVMLGEIRRFAGNFAPGGWAFCDGQLLPISQNTALFSILGTTYGGNGISTFALPDLRGRTPIHVGQGVGLSNRVLGQPGGQENVTLTSDMNAAHVHTFRGSAVTGSSGSNAPVDNMMPYVGLTFIVSVSAGTFPSRDGGNSGTFIGEVRMFGGNFAPSGWASTDGQVLAISTNTALFSILGTTYGGNGTSNFALPDLRGRAPVGAGTGAGLSPQILGQASGQETVVLTTTQLPPHTHTLPIGGSTDSAGSGQPHTNLQPTLALTPIMAVAGVFPSQDGSPGDNFLDEVRLFAGNFVPGGWALTDGTLLAINTNIAVFSLTGTQYGGNGVNNFALPDLRGRAAIHRGQGPGLTLRTIGQTIGTEAEPLTISQMGSHTHSVPVSGAAAPALSTLGCVALTAVLLAIGLARLRQSDSRA